MAQIQTRGIAPDAVDDTKVKLRNNNSLRARNAANSADVNLLKLDTSNVLQLLTQTQIATTPSVANDVANKNYVDTQVQNYINGLTYKSPARAASTANVPLTGGATLTIDTVTIANGDRILLKDQSTGADNGIYVASGIGTAYTLSRASDASTSAEVLSGMYLFITEGSANVDLAFILTTPNPITLGTTALTFSSFPVVSNVVAGNGLSKSGNTLNVLVDTVNNTTKINGSNQVEGLKNNKESLTLSGADITNQYKDLSKLIATNSLVLEVMGVIQIQGTDYTLSTVGGVTRVSFAGDLASGGAISLQSGDVLYCQYEYLN